MCDDDVWLLVRSMTFKLHSSYIHNSSSSSRLLSTAFFELPWNALYVAYMKTITTLKDAPTLVF